ncbi:hypothetical protein WG66_008249 [Moniliophthora roreri]|nr:hypothetical protein WG66_008249 [Moniliophthora roreri]
MASSVALVFVVNLATIRGHLAEMISIFVYPVIGYFWTRRRRRSAARGFSVAESSLPTMEPTSAIDILVRYRRRMSIGDNLRDFYVNTDKRAVSSLCRSIHQETEHDMPSNYQKAWKISQRVRLLRLEGKSSDDSQHESPVHNLRSNSLSLIGMCPATGQVAGSSVSQAIDDDSESPKINTGDSPLCFDSASDHGAAGAVEETPKAESQQQEFPYRRYHGQRRTTRH